MIKLKEIIEISGMSELNIIKNKVKLLKDEGNNLESILNKLNDLNEDMIITSYYQLNNGPDLRDYQNECFENYKKLTHIEKINYKILWCCGLGKTKMALSIAFKMNYKSICIALPNILLLEQFEKELNYFYPETKIYKLCSLQDKKEFSYFTGNKEIDIKNLLLSDNEFKIVLTTYHSSKIIRSVCDKIDFTFDLVICDECHHLLNKSNTTFNEILMVKYNHRLLLSATPGNLKENAKSYSLFNSEIFKGENDIRDIEWGIEKEYITDYRLLVMYDTINLEEEFTRFNIENIKTELFISAYMCLKSLYQGLSTKTLIYCNTVKNAEKVKDIIDRLITYYNGNKNCINIFGLTLNIKNFELNGKHSISHRREKLQELKNADYGILTSVQIFGEGFDYPDLDTVIFSEKMSSTIRIIQSAMRPCRKNKNDPLKIAKIILPIFSDGEYGKIKQVLSTFNNIDDPLKKIRLINLAIKRKISLKERILEEKYNTDISIETKKILEKIELTYLKRNLLDRNFINPNSKIDIEKINNILLLPLSEKSFNNFYKSVITREYNNCYWGQKYKDKKCPNFKIWDQINVNDLLVFVEKNKLSFGYVKYKKKSRDIALELWNDRQYGLIYNFEVIKRIDINKRQFMIDIGYKRTDNLMSSRIYKGDKRDNIIKLV